MKEFIPGICWQEWYTTHQKSVDALNNTGFKALRIFFNLRDLPRKSESTSWPGYIQYLFNTMPNGQQAWNTPNKTPEPMRATFDFCKKYKWLPIVCMGTSEESVRGEWIGRVPTDWNWIGRFCKEFAYYLKYTMGFDRADLEVWNEPFKVWGFDYKPYCTVAYLMGSNWKTIPNYKLSVFNDDLLRQSFLDGVLTDTKLMGMTDYIGTHIGVGSEDYEWDYDLIECVNEKIVKYPHLKQALTEMSVNGTWSRLNKLPGNVAMYGIIGAIRNIEFGTATRIDDVWMWDRAGNLQCSSPQKAETLRVFNITNYKPYEVVEDDMKLDKIYEVGSRSIGVTFIQKVLNYDIDIDLDPKLVVDGWYGKKTEDAVKLYQKNFNLKEDGRVGEITFKVMIFGNQNLFDELVYEYSVGKR